MGINKNIARPLDVIFPLLGPETIFHSFLKLKQQQQSLFQLSGVGYMITRTPLRSNLCHVLR